MIYLELSAYIIIIALISVDYGSFCNIMGSSFIHCGYGETENNNIYQNLSGSILQISGSSEVKLENSSIDSCYSFESGTLIINDFHFF